MVLQLSAWSHALTYHVTVPRIPGVLTLKFPTPPVMLWYQFPLTLKDTFVALSTSATKLRFAGDSKIPSIGELKVHVGYVASSSVMDEHALLPLVPLVSFT